MSNKISGIYKITNNVTDYYYIGSSNNIKHRWTNHKCKSSWKRQPNSKLYQDMQKYGLDKFTFEILEETDNLREREQYWIEQLNSNYNDRRAILTIAEHVEQNKQWCKSHRIERVEQNKRWYKFHRNEQLEHCRSWYDRLCLYNGETLTLRALSLRFLRQGISHPTQEAKKYLQNNKENI